MGWIDCTAAWTHKKAASKHANLAGTRTSLGVRFNAVPYSAQRLPPCRRGSAAARGCNAKRPRRWGRGRSVRGCCGQPWGYPSRRAESFSSMSRVMLSRSYVGFQSHSCRAHRHQEHFRPGMMLLAGLARLFERRVCTRSRPAWAVRMAPLLCRRAEVQKLLATLSAEYLDCARRDDPVATTAAHSLPMLIV